MYDDRTRYSMPHGMTPLSKKTPWGGTPVWLAAVVAVLLLVVAGAAYRAMAARVQGGDVVTVRLPVPLEQLPARVAGWVGENLPIPETTKMYMGRNFADDYVNRRYIDAARGLWANVYVVYCSSRPGGILGHQPGVCYPANGWIPDGRETSEITSRSGRPISCLIHRFHMPAPAYQETVVLSFYVLNGQITVSENDFSGPLGRRPNLSGDPARYVAQVQVSSNYEHSVRTAASQMADIILAFLPDQEGHVRATGLGGELKPAGEIAEGGK